MKSIVIAGYARSPFTLAKKGGLVRVRPDDHHRRRGARAGRAHRRRSQRDRGPDPRLRLSGSRAGPQHGASRRAARRPAAVGRRRHRQPLLRLLDARDPHRRRADPARCRRGLHLRRRREHDAHPDGRLQSDAEPGAQRQDPRRLHRAWATPPRTSRAAGRSPAPRRRNSPCAATSAPPPHRPRASSPTRSCRSRPAGQVVDKDGCIRPETSAEGLAALKTAFDQDGSVTAGTSSPLTDGAAAVLLCSEEFAKRHDLEPLARLASVAVAGCDPDVMGIGPVVGDAQGAEARQYRDRQDRRGRTERGLRLAGAGLHARTRHPRRDAQHRRGRHRARPSARRHRRAHHRQGGEPLEARGRPLCPGHPVHRRRPGHRHDHGASVMAADFRRGASRKSRSSARA